MRTVFDVGANNGDSMLGQAYHSQVHAFEPTPEMCDVIRSKTRHLPNYRLNQVAVSNFNGKATFNVAGQADWGCSSLHTFNDGLEKSWPGRTDFRVSDQIEVDVTRLDRYIQENNITQIDYFHCDVQGSDLQVLEGLGEYINIVQEGAVETAPDQEELALYKGVDNSLTSVVRFLAAHGFRNIHITPWSNEYNIHFKRS